MLKNTLTSTFIIFLLLITGRSFSTLAQASGRWSPQQNVPGYHPDTWPPILIADRNRTVHAFSSQRVGEDNDTLVLAIMYNQWTLEGGWTDPVDILLSPIKNAARLTSAHLDQNGIMHVVFWGGDNTDANLYYSRAPAVDAGKIQAWSSPRLVAKRAADPENAVFYTVNSNQLGILYSGLHEGLGLYSIHSSDNGETWSDPILIFNTTNYYLVQRLQVFQGESGFVHAIWNEITSGGQGRIIRYSRLNLEELNWSDPINLGEAGEGYGTNTPAIIGYHNEIFVFYNNRGSILMRLSRDGGITWEGSTPMFRHHVGVNGSLSLVVDGNDKLNIFFGQREPGDPTLQGVWHSIWQGSRWSEPEAIVSGPAIIDLTGVKSFDPYEARAVVSQGNVILVTWRTDPGLKANGVWHSFKILDAPESPIMTLIADPLLITPISSSPSSEPTSFPQDVFKNKSTASSPPNFNDDFQELENPGRSIANSIIPAFVLVVIVIFIVRILSRK